MMLPLLSTPMARASVNMPGPIPFEPKLRVWVAKPEDDDDKAPSPCGRIVAIGLLPELEELEFEDENAENKAGTKLSKGMPNAPTSEHTTIKTMMMGSLEPIQYPKSKPRG